MVKSALHTPTTLTTDARASQDCPSTMTSGSCSQPEGALLGGPDSATDSFGIGSFDLVRQFVELVVAKNAAAGLGNGHFSKNPIDWEAVEAAVAGSRSFEQAIGRAVVVADQMCRGVFDDTHPGGPLSSPSAGGPVSSPSAEPFFAFSNADVIPDFGDESRYRTRMARKVARIFGNRAGDHDHD